MWAYVISIFLDGYITLTVKELTKTTLSSKASLWTSVWQGQTLFIPPYQPLQQQPRRFWTWEHSTVAYTLAYSARFIFSVMSHTSDEQLTDSTAIWFLLLNAAVICAVSWEFWPHTRMRPGDGKSQPKRGLSDHFFILNSQTPWTCRFPTFFAEETAVHQPPKLGMYKNQSPHVEYKEIMEREIT